MEGKETTAIEGSFSQCIPKPVIDQINVREEKWGKPSKTVEELEVIHGNTVWAVLRSGVNVPEDEGARSNPVVDRTTVTTTDKLARQTILGGEMKKEVSPGNQFKFDYRAGVELTTADINKAAYRKDSVQGHRPVPGITGFTVKTLDTWGMIMETNIQIKCWSRDDLEKLDLVYFKPGFPALFEWGHTLYFKEDGSICKNPGPIITNSDFFGNISYQDYSDLDRRVYEGRQQNCNQEAVFGFITNFSWSFNADGSYDCSLQILSKGAVLKGLRLTSTGEEDRENEKQKDVDWWNTSPYHGILKAFQDRYERLSSGKQIFTKVEDVPDVLEANKELKRHKMPGRSSRQESKKNDTSASLISGEKAIRGSLISIKIPAAGNEILVDFPVVTLPVAKGFYFFGWHRKVECFYITLRSLLHIINVVSGGSTGSGGFYFDTLSDSTFGDSFSTHASLNPLVAVKPSQIDNAKYRLELDGVMSNAKNAQRQCKEDNQILNIWINYNSFVQIVENMISSSPEGYRIEQVISEFLASIQKAFGNVNYFGLHNNSSDTSYFEIVDRTMVRPEDNYLKDIPRINVTGLKNTVVGLQVKSDVSNDIANSMCIAAASPAAKTEGADNADTEIVFWGENCTPRWSMGSSNSGNSLKSKVANQRKEFDTDKGKWKEKFEKFYEDIRGGKLSGSGKSDPSARFEEMMKGVAEKLTFFQVDGERYYRNEDRESVTSGSYLHMGLIPYKMTLTLLGLSRLYIGNIFMLKNNGILPRKYDNWGYLITGISHTIKNNQWFTEITTNYFPVFSGLKVKSSSKAPQDTYVWKSEDTEEDSRTPNREFNDDCDYRKAFTDAGIEYPIGTSGNSRCGRYTYNWARTYVKGRSALEGGATYNEGHYEPRYGAGGNANEERYWNYLENLGYQRGSSVQMTGAEISRLKGGKTVNGITIKEGDVIQYGKHTCFYDGTRWCSDFDQNTAWVYGKKDSPDTVYDLRLFSSPPKHKDWECGVHQDDFTQSAYW